MRKILLVGTIALAPTGAFAQGAIVQGGAMTKYDLGGFIQDHTLESSSKMFTDNGRGFNPVHILDSGGNAYCAESALTSVAYNQICFGHDSSGNAVISINNFGGAAAQPLKFSINGNTFTWPGTGTGSVLGPDAVTPGNVAVWLSPTAIQDLGLAPITSLPARTLLGNSSNSAGTLAAVPSSGTFGNVMLSGGSPIFTGNPSIENILPTLSMQTTLSPANGVNLGNQNYNDLNGVPYVQIVGTSADITSGAREGRWRVQAIDPATNTLQTAIDVFGNSTTLGGTLTAADLATTGTIAGSLCRTSDGSVIYKVGANCF